MAMNRRGFLQATGLGALGLLVGPKLFGKSKATTQVVPSVAEPVRRLRASYTTELAQDLRFVHGLDAEVELRAILKEEMQREIGNTRGMLKPVKYIDSDTFTPRIGFDFIPNGKYDHTTMWGYDQTWKVVGA